MDEVGCSATRRGTLDFWAAVCSLGRHRFELGQLREVMRCDAMRRVGSKLNERGFLLDESPREGRRIMVEGRWRIGFGMGQNSTQARRERD